MSVATLQSGGTIWGLVKAKLGPGASDAEIQKATTQVLEANGQTWESARSMRAGTEVNLSVLDPKPAAAPAAEPAAAAPATPAATPGTDAALAANGALPPSLAQLLNSALLSSDPSLNPFLASLGFDPQALVAGATPNGAVNIPGISGPNFNGLGAFLNAQGALNPNNVGSLAFNTGSFVNQISGIQFTAFDPARILAQFPGLVS